MSTSPARRPVVCGIDDSDLARAAAQLAGGICRRLGCGLVLVYVAEMEEGIAQAARDLTYLHEAAVDAGRCAFEPIVREHGLDAELQVELGHPAERLVSAAAEHDAQLLVVGSRGRGRFMTGLLGSVSRRIARDAPCPVVVVSPRAAATSKTFSDERHEPLVLCGLDHAQGFRTLLLAVDLSQRLGARLLIGHAYDNPPPMATSIAPGKMAPDTDRVTQRRWERGRDLLERAALIAQDEGATAIETRLLAGDPSLSLNALADRESADLIVIGSHGQGWIRSTLLGSVSSALAASAPTPIAILPPGARIAPRSGHYEVALGRRSQERLRVG
jgi:nucleotide-binding universal stress UspA family protein